MYTNGCISPVDLSWTAIIDNLYLWCPWSFHVHLTAFAIFMLFHHPTAIRAFQAVPTVLFLKPKLNYVMIMPNPS